MSFIEEYRFGLIRIAGETYRNDLKILRGEVLPKWWRKSTHVFDVRDLRDVLEARPAVLVCGIGSSGMAQVSGALSLRLAELNIELLTRPTAEAVELFNHLHKSGEDVAGAFHLTC